VFAVGIGVRASLVGAIAFAILDLLTTQHLYATAIVLSGIAALILVTRLKGSWRLVALVPTLYLAAFVWENLLLENITGPTRLILLGATLVILMNARPQGLFGTPRVEIV